MYYWEFPNSHYNGKFNKKEKTSGVPIRNDQSQCNLLHHLISSPFAIKINPISFLVTKNCFVKDLWAQVLTFYGVPWRISI